VRGSGGMQKRGFICISMVILLLSLCPLKATALEKTFTNSLGMAFVLIPAGTFVMGSPPTEPFRDKGETQHPVKISRPFYLQVTDVTLAQWWALMGRKLMDPRKGPGDFPVTRVSWYDCRDFIKALNERHEGTYRLPTEAEWEYAARAGTTTAYSWGDDIDCTRAMYANNSLKSPQCIGEVKARGLKPDGPAPVKSYPPNPWGLFDMHGNIWQWCRDRFGSYSTTLQVDPGGPPSGIMRVRRGGSWYRYGYSCRSANRAFAHPASRFRTTGFRLVREVP
jgi:sulfatase modifying factor 1